MPISDNTTKSLVATPDPTRVPTTCGQCGQTDSDPKVQILGLDEPHHNDCLPHRYRQMTVESSPAAAAIVEACEGGLRGDELLAFIDEQDHTPTTSTEA